ncbi:hypothetical protein BK140_16215 [Paenibacillus macerans]|nr:hypothetical protein BK140_16215 [Paenibacillus macerans]
MIYRKPSWTLAAAVFRVRKAAVLVLGGGWRFLTFWGYFSASFPNPVSKYAKGIKDQCIYDNHGWFILIDILYNAVASHSSNFAHINPNA